MPKLIHLAPKKLELRIRRSGLRASPALIVDADEHVTLHGVFAMPVLPDFQKTYQWIRELRSWRGELVAVHFRVPTDEHIYVGHYGKTKLHGPAGEVLTWFRDEPSNAWGGEVFVPRRIDKGEIIDIKAIRQDVGWRQTPHVNHKYQCVCEGCLPPGSPKLLRRCRAVFNRGVERIRKAEEKSGSEAEVIEALRGMSVALERVGYRLSPKKLLSLSNHGSPLVRRELALTLGYFSGLDESALLPLLNDEDRAVQVAASRAALRGLGPQRGLEVVRRAEDASLVGELVDELRHSSAKGAKAALEQLATSTDQVLAARAAQAVREFDAVGRFHI